MVEAALTLPDNVAELKEIILRLQAEFSEAESRNKQLRERLAILEEFVRLVKVARFGSRTEKYGTGKDQPMLPFFDESWGTEEETVEEAAPAAEEVAVPAHTRKKPVRKPLPEGLPRVEVVHDLPEEEKVCPCGKARVEIGREVSEQLDVVPAKIQVVRHVRIKYALAADCRCGEGGGARPVLTAPMPEQMVPKSLAGPGLLAHVLTAKFVDALPFYRQEAHFERMGIDLKRATLCHWALQVGERLGVLSDLLLAQIRSWPVLQMDETPVQVMNEKGRANTAKSYMWVVLGGPPGQRAAVFRYHPTRAGAVAKELLGGYKGYVQTDGYSGYEFLRGERDIAHVGCLAHIRRKFVDVLKAAGKSPGAGGKGNAEKVVEEIARLYALEKAARDGRLSPEQVLQLRREQSRPVFEKLGQFLKELQPKTPPTGLLGKAVGYAVGQWDRLGRYLEDGRVPIDNNLVENAIRPFCLGRKNWLFHGHPDGAAAGAAIYTVIETARLNGLEPYAYLRFLFENLPGARGMQAIRALLPTHLDADFQPRP